MKRPSISRSTPIHLGLALSLLGATWKLSSRMTSLEDRGHFDGQRIAALETEQRTLIEMKTDIAVIREKVERIERPIYHTHADVQSLRKEVAQLNFGPLTPFYHGPLSVVEKGYSSGRN